MYILELLWPDGSKPTAVQRQPTKLIWWQKLFTNTIYKNKGGINYDSI